MAEVELVEKVIQEHENLRETTLCTTVQFGYRLSDKKWVAHFINRYGVSVTGDNLVDVLEEVNRYIKENRHPKPNHTKFIL